MLDKNILDKPTLDKVILEEVLFSHFIFLKNCIWLNIFSLDYKIQACQQCHHYFELECIRVFFTRKSARFYAFRYKSTPSTALPSMLARTKICKRTRSDYRLFLLWFTVPLVFQLKLQPYTVYMALCSVFLAYLFLKFDHNNQENIVINIKILAPHEGLQGLSSIIVYKTS